MGLPVIRDNDATSSRQGMVSSMRRLRNLRRNLLRFGPVLSMLAILAATACGTEDRLTVAEYAQICAAGIASAASLIEPDRVTWGELRDLAADSAETMRSVNPPEELSEFHRMSLKTLDFVADVADEQDREALANPLAFGLEAIRIATQLRRSVDDLPSDLRSSLAQSGCL